MSNSQNPSSVAFQNLLCSSGVVSEIQFLNAVEPINPLWTNYASPTSGEAYRDRRLTTNFEL